MSAGLAPPPFAIDRADADAIRLRSDEFVADARRVGDDWLVVPNERGLRTLRRLGKAGLVARWRAWLTDDAQAVDSRWRLLEALPPGGSEAESRCLQPQRAPILGAPEFPAHGALRCPVRVPIDLAVFAGHFPAMAVVPAVVQIGWAVDLARTHLCPGARFGGIVTAKFRRIMRPGMQLTLSLDCDATAGRMRFEYDCAGSPVSNGRVSLGSSHG